MFQATTAVRKISAMKKRLHILQGGSSAGKTIAVLLILINKAQSVRGKTISVVSETLPHLKKGAIRDFLSIMQAHHYYKDEAWNRTDFIYTFETGTKLEFFSADSAAKVRGPRRDILFVNECNNISYETYTQLAIRTNEEIFLDYNPVSEFWVHTDLIPSQDHDFAILTYKDNEGLPQAIVEEIESRRGNRAFWKVYGEGQLGAAEGRIYINWQQIDEVPFEAKLYRYGLDFGYSNDPTAIVATYKYNGGYLFDEVVYQKGMSNKAIYDAYANLERALTKADSSEPKSIDELKSYGLLILPATKGPGSVNQGIQMIQEQKIYVTKSSLNLLKEYRNYLWEVDDDGKILNVPVGGMDHCLDSCRYSLENSHLGSGQAHQFVPASVRGRYTGRPSVPMPGIG